MIWGLVTIAPASTAAPRCSIEKPARKPGGRRATARYVEVGGCGGFPGGWVLAATARRSPENVTAVRASSKEGFYERRKPVCPILSAIFV